jgi:hypothetical protein
MHIRLFNSRRGGEKEEFSFTLLTSLVYDGKIEAGVLLTMRNTNDAKRR